MLTGDIGKTVREAGGAIPDASGAIPDEGLFGTQTKHREQAPDITPEEEQGYGYAPPSGQQQVGSATYTNEDFYPGPADPAQFAFREGLQVVARPGRMPMGAIAKAAASIERKRQQTKQAKDQLYSLTQKRFAGIDPNRRKLIYEMQDKEIDKEMREYYLSGEKQPLEGKSARTDKRVQRIEKRLQELRSIGYDEENETIKQLESKKTRLEGKQSGIRGKIDSLGDEAYMAAKSNPREMDKLWAKAAKDPVFRSKLMETVRMNEATVYRYNYIYNSAKKYIEDVDDPKQGILKDPFIYNSAWKIVNPGKEATIEQLAYAETEYNRAWELNAYFKENVLPTAEKLAANWNAEVQPEGSYYELTESNDWQNFIEAQKDALLSDAPESVKVWYNSKNNKGPDHEPSKDQMDEAAKEILNGFLGEVVKKSISQKPVREYRAPSGNEKTGRGKPMAAVVETAGYPNSNLKYFLAFSPTEYTGGKVKRISSWALTKQDWAAPKEVSNPRFVWIEPLSPTEQGRFAIQGRIPSETQMVSLQRLEEQQAEAVTPEEKEKIEKEIKKINTTIENSKPDEFPFSDNGDFIEAAYGSRNPYEIISQSIDRIFTAEQIENNWKRPEYRDFIMKKLKISDRPTGASQPSGASQGTQQRAEAPPEQGAVRIEGYDGWWKEVNGEVVKVG